MKNEEHQIQAGIVEAVSYLPECEWLHAIPNGGKRNIVTAAKLKKEGVKPGVSDLFLPIPMGHNGKIYHGLYIEVKVPNRGRLSKDQKRFAAHCEKYDYFFSKVESVKEGVNVILWYLQRLKKRHEHRTENIHRKTDCIERGKKRNAESAA